MHYIRYDVLYAYVLARLQYWSMMIQKDEDKLLKRLLNASDRERNSAKKKQAAELKKAEKRKAEVDGLFAKMYEDWSAGRITEYNFNMLSEKYQNEQKELETKIRQLHEMMEAAVPVSYTHLDVYKRQAQATPGGSDTAAAGAERRRYRTAPERAATGSTEKETRDGAMT